MHPRSPVARLAETLPQGFRWQAIGLVRPLAAMAVLALGTSVFSIGAGLLGDRSGAAIGHVMAGPTRAVQLQPLAVWPGSTPPVDTIDEAELEHLLHGLKDGVFGVTFTAAEGMPVTGWRPTVMVDADLPPLRVEIMGMGYVPNRARGLSNALVRAP
jgi:hypothetical protein